MSLTVLDLSAAFNTVDHSILTSTLKNKFGIDELAVKWFNSYLQPRLFKVAVNGKYSDEKQLTYSVPWGSCSDAYLVNLYCSTLNDIVPSDQHLSGFTDDHSVRKEFRANDRNAELQIKEEIEECVVNIRSWMDWVRLKMNSGKTEFIYFGSKVQLSKCVVAHLNVNDEIVERVVVIKYLGAGLDAQLSFKEHTTKKMPDSNNKLFIYKKHLPFTHCQCLQDLTLKSMHFHLDYANALLYGLPAITLSKFQRIQNMCA